jgi:type I restriction enzyme M protein
MPNGVFAPYTSIPTNLLFFDRSGPTKEIWYYELHLPEGRKTYTKTQPIRFEEFEACLAWWNKREENDRAWRVHIEDALIYDGQTALISANLDIRNPRAEEDFKHMPPERLIADIMAREVNITKLIDEIRIALETAF